MKLLSLLYSFHGRIGRGSYWLGVAITLTICVLLWLSVSLSPRANGPEDAYSSVISFVLFILFFLVPTWAALGTKRLHDRNKRGWWLLLFYPLAAWLYWDGSARQEPNLIMMAAGGVLFLWGVIELGFLAGTPGENPYGSSPSTGLTGADEEPTLPGA